MLNLCSNPEHKKENVQLLYICKAPNCQTPYLCSLCIMEGKEHYDSHKEYFASVDYLINKGLLYYYEVQCKKLKEQELKKKIAEKLLEDFNQNFEADKKNISTKFESMKKLTQDFISNEFDYHKKHFLSQLDKLNLKNKEFIENKFKESSMGYTFFKEKQDDINYQFNMIDEYVSTLDKKAKSIQAEIEEVKRSSGLLRSGKIEEIKNEIKEFDLESDSIKERTNLEESIQEKNERTNLEESIQEKNQQLKDLEKEQKEKVDDRNQTAFLDKLRDIDAYMNTFCKENQSNDGDFWKHANKSQYSGFIDCIDRDINPRIKSQVNDLCERLNKSCFFIDGFAWQSSYSLQNSGVIQRFSQITARSINSFYEESKKIIGQVYILNRLDLHLDNCFQSNSASIKFFTTICKALPITVIIESQRLSARTNNISENNILDICYSLKQFKNVEYLNIDLSQNQINTECLFTISETLKYFKEIKNLTLDITANHDYERAVPSLIAQIKKMKDLKTLTINLDMKTMDCLKDFGTIFDTKFTKMEKFSQKFELSDNLEEVLLDTKLDDIFDINNFKKLSPNLRNIIIRAASRDYLWAFDSNVDIINEGIDCRIIGVTKQDEENEKLIEQKDQTIAIEVTG